MQQLTKNEQKLANYLLKSKNLIWDKYMQRFTGDKPLELWPTNLLPEKISRLEMKDCFNDGSIWYDFSSKFSLKKFGDINIEIGFTKPVKLDDIEKINVLSESCLRSALFREHIIEELLKICPGDFEPIPVVLESWHPKSEQFSIKGFYALNVLKCIQAIDEEQSIIKWSENGSATIRKLKYKENPWQDGVIPIKGPTSPRDATKYPVHKTDEPCKIAIDAFSGAILYHPEVAKLIPSHPYYYFITDTEQNKLKGIIE